MIVRALVPSFIVAVVCLLNACATPAGGKEDEAYQPKEYRTGSNLPSRDSSRVQTIGGSDIQTMRGLPSGGGGPVKSGP